MPKLNEQQLRERAKLAAIESAPKNGVGEFLQLIEEEENVVTFVFASKMKGYVGWTWSVSLFTTDEETTVSEVNLMPGEDSLVAPNWVPWAERLADYKALQAELEAQAALEAAESEDLVEDDEESDGETSSEDSDDEEVSAEANEADVEAVDESATTLAPESPEAESDADSTSARVPRFLRRRLGRLKNKK